MKNYYSLNDYCKETFGQKVYKLPLNGGMTCPNRDGKLSTRGCLFCSAGGSGDFTPSSLLSVTDQIEEAKKLIAPKTNCNKFIAYFQAFTNTYASVSYLRRIFTEAVSQPDICALSIGTRSDCLSPEIIKLLSELNKIKPVWVELGLQTIHQTTLDYLNTHTSLPTFESALAALKAENITVIAHLILGLPGESREMMLESVDYAAHCGIDGIKLQLLHVLSSTPLGEIYRNKPFKLFELDEYCDFVVDCIERLPKDMVIHRITGDGPRNLLIAPKWSTDKKRVLNTINKNFKLRETYQGRLFRP